METQQRLNVPKAIGTMDQFLPAMKMAHGQGDLDHVQVSLNIETNVS